MAYCVRCGEDGASLHHYEDYKGNKVSRYHCSDCARNAYKYFREEYREVLEDIEQIEKDKLIQKKEKELKRSGNDICRRCLTWKSTSEGSYREKKIGETMCGYCFNEKKEEESKKMRYQMRGLRKELFEEISKEIKSGWDATDFLDKECELPEEDKEKLRELQREVTEEKKQNSSVSTNQTEPKTLKIDGDTLPSSTQNSDHNPFNQKENFETKSQENLSKNTTEKPSIDKSSKSISCHECQKTITVDQQVYTWPNEPSKNFCGKCGLDREAFIECLKILDDGGDLTAFIEKNKDKFSTQLKTNLLAAQRIKQGQKVDIDNLSLNAEGKQWLKEFQQKVNNKRSLTSEKIAYIVKVNLIAWPLIILSIWLIVRWRKKRAKQKQFK